MLLADRSRLPSEVVAAGRAIGLSEDRRQAADSRIGAFGECFGNPFNDWRQGPRPVGSRFRQPVAERWDDTNLALTGFEEIIAAEDGRA